MKQTTIRIEHPLSPGTEIRPEDAWTFPAGLIGLPDYRTFARIPLEHARPFHLLAATDDPSFGLILVDPVALVPGYELVLETEDLSPLGDVGSPELEVLVPVVLPHGEGRLSLNLRGPLVFAPSIRKAIQVVSRNEQHAVRFEPELVPRSTPCSS